MTLNNDQLSTVLLLIETSTLSEPELSEAWELHNFIQDYKMKDVEIELLQQAIASGQVSAAQIEQHREAGEIHSCSLYCDRPACVKTQRDELRTQIEAIGAGGVSGRLMPPTAEREFPALNYDERRTTIINSLRSSKSWTTAYATAFVDDYFESTQPPTAQPGQATCEKAAFEAWAGREGLNIRKSEPKTEGGIPSSRFGLCPANYYFDEAECAWRAWANKPITQPAEPYDQTSLELCSVCGWKALIPGDCCLNCEHDRTAQPQQSALHELISDPNAAANRGGTTYTGGAT